MLIYGINPVAEALRAGRVKELRVSERTGGRIGELIRHADEQGIPVRRAQSEELDRTFRGVVHQGVVAELRELEHFSPAELATSARGVPLIVVLDGIEDPHNLGAILRTAEAAGADGVVRQSRRAAPLGGWTSHATKNRNLCTS